MTRVKLFLVCLFGLGANVVLVMSLYGLNQLTQTQKNYSDMSFNFEKIINATEDFVMNYAQSSLENSIKSALEDVPYRIFGLTFLETSQIRNGLIPASAMQKIWDNAKIIQPNLRSVEFQLHNLPTAIEVIESYITSVITKENISQQAINALNKTKEINTQHRDLVANFGNHLAQIINKLQIFLADNVSSHNVHEITPNVLMIKLNTAINFIKPDIEKFAQELNKKAEFKKQLAYVLTTYKAINFSEINAKRIAHDILTFVQQNVPHIA